MGQKKLSEPPLVKKHSNLVSRKTTNNMASIPSSIIVNKQGKEETVITKIGGGEMVINEESGRTMS